MPLLLAIAVLTGVLTTIVFRYTTNAPAIRIALRKIYAHLLEFRLFFDEPRLIWNAQLALLRENARLFRLLLVPTLILALPMLWLFWQLDAVYGHRPLRLGESAIVTAKLTTDQVALQSTGGLTIETPPIKVLHQNQIVWRVRQAAEGKGEVHPASAKINYPKSNATWMIWFVATSTAAALLAARWPIPL